MEQTHFDGKKFRAGFVLILVLAIAALFLAVVWPFLQALLVGAMFAGLCHPLYRWIRGMVRGRESLASILTILILFLIVAGPVSAILGIVTKQAINISNHAFPWLQERFSNANSFDPHEWLVKRLPMVADFIPSKEEIINGLTNATKAAGTFMAASASTVAAGTAGFILNVFVMLYAMFFFLKDGRTILGQVFYYMPLAHDDEMRMLDRFISVTRATIKGTLLIGLIQGVLAGIAFYVAGIDGAVFWGTVMVVLSVIPGIGAALVWVPAVGYLYIIGHPVAATLLLIWCALVVGTIDNVLRPTLVGKDAEMPDLLILIGTLGGIYLFGAIGFVVGPIVCGLFLTALDIYGTTFKHILPPAKSLRTKE